MKDFAPRTPAAKAPEPATGKGVALVDNRASTVAQRKLQDAIAASPRPVAQRQAAPAPPAAPRPNRTGLPDKLKAGVESLSGHSLDDVKVHYNSAKPAQLQAHAYAQGTDIHLGPGQEKHLPHEAWHVVQQKQGRVQKKIKSGSVYINDNRDLENEADKKGAESLNKMANKNNVYDKLITTSLANPLAQRKIEAGPASAPQVLSSFDEVCLKIKELFEVEELSPGRVKFIKRYVDVYLNNEKKHLNTYEIFENIKRAENRKRKHESSSDEESSSSEGRSSSDEESNDMTDTPVRKRKQSPAKNKAAKAERHSVPRRRSKNKERKDMIMEKIKILISDENPLKLSKNIHSSKLYTGKQKMHVSPKKKSDSINFLRHIATVINSEIDGLIEVQAAMKKGTIYVASNSGESKLPTNFSLIKILCNNIIKNDEADERVVRHAKKLLIELTDARFKGLKYEIVKGLANQHAETKIVDKHPDVEAIAGQRRPCIACFIYMKLKKIKFSVYNQHNGAFWNSKNALMSIVNMIFYEINSKYKNALSDDVFNRELNAFMRNNKAAFSSIERTHVNKGIAKKHEHDVDTDSE